MQCVIVPLNQYDDDDDYQPLHFVTDMTTTLSASCPILNLSALSVHAQIRICEGFVPPRWKDANVIPVLKVHPPRSIQSDLRPKT